MISHLNRCIFVHIPKTGGTSIENLIWTNPRTTSDLCMGFIGKYHNKYQTGGLQHLFATHIREEVGNDIFSSYYKFTILRNPWDKAISQFSYMDKREDLRDFIGMKKGDCFKKYLSLIRNKKHVQWESQVNFLRDLNGDWLVDYMGKFETFSESVFHILSTIGIRVTAIPHENKGDRGSYQNYYDTESMEMIASMYSDDISTFGYSFVPLSPWDMQ